MDLKLNIPSYLSITKYQEVNAIEHLSDADKVIQTLAILSDTPADKFKKLQSKDLSKILDGDIESVLDVSNEFYPIIEVEGVLYGYQPITKMTLGEYIDLENLSKNPTANLDQIMAVLYRPVLKHRFKSLEFKVKNGIKIAQGKIENVLKYYTVEEYDSSKREDLAEIMADLPVSYALGALSFFLQTASLHLRGTEIYSYKTKSPKEKKKMLTEMAKTLSLHIGDGLLQFTTSLQHPSLVSREIKLSQL